MATVGAAIAEGGSSTIAERVALQRIALGVCGARIALVTALGFPSEASAQNFDEIYVFGDSLSDVGNVFKATRGESPSSPPYFKGRYSNGPVWVEYLASKLKLTSNPNTNFAYGGATTGDSRDMPPGLLRQIKSFTTTHASANPKALYIVWAGSNDYLGGATDSTAPINNLAIAVKSLSAAGAKNILVVNLPDLGKLPGTRTTQHSDFLNDLTKEHNSRLAASLKDMRQKLNPDIHLAYLDVNSLFKQVSSTPEKFGFTNVTNSCFSQGRICDRPNEYLFWDNVHPTTAAHKLLVELTFSTLKPAPQPVSVSEPALPVALGAIAVGGLGAGLILKHQTAIKNKF